MRIRRHLSYANVVATLALLLALGGGAYAIERVNSREIVNDTIKSVDLKDRKAVRAADVKRDGLRGKQIDEGTLDASRFVPIAGDEAGDCDPIIVCVHRLRERPPFDSDARSRAVRGRYGESGEPWWSSKGDL